MKKSGVADSTGNHNAFVDTTTGVGTTGGSTPVASAVFPGASSVAGQFGQALSFAGDNYMQYPELTELMSGNGAPSFTVSLWLNVPTGTTPGNAYTTLSDWGNAASDGSSNTRFVYAFGPNGTGQTRAQVRLGTGNGSDLFQANGDTGLTLGDDNWHMLSWTYDTDTGDVVSYFDGVSLGVTDTSDPGSGMADAAAAYGTLGFKGDSGSFLPSGTLMDEVWVLDGVASQGEGERRWGILATAPYSKENFEPRESSGRAGGLKEAERLKAAEPFGLPGGSSHALDKPPCRSRA